MLLKMPSCTSRQHPKRLENQTNTRPRKWVNSNSIHHIADLSEALAQVLGELDFVFNEQNFHGVILEECSLFVDYEFVIWLLAPCR